jgi:hypothetical protein
VLDKEDKEVTQHLKGQIVHFHYLIIIKRVLQWKQLNVIASVQSQSDNINRMITIAELVGNIKYDRLLFKS